MTGSSPTIDHDTGYTTSSTTPPRVESDRLLAWLDRKIGDIGYLLEDEKDEMIREHYYGERDAYAFIRDGVVEGLFNADWRYTPRQYSEAEKKVLSAVYEGYLEDQARAHQRTGTETRHDTT